MKKIIILIIAIVVVFVTMISYSVYCYNLKQNYIAKQNKTFESFLNTEALGTDIASLINKIDDTNTKNNVKKDSNEKYENNNTNSISFEIKFSELDKVISLEVIEKQGVDQFVKNFGAMSFKCTNIEYHKNTGYVKYMYFEEV